MSILNLWEELALYETSRPVNLRDLQNFLNPLDHPWNFDTATVAKSRLREIVRADRKACPVSHWVATSTYSVRPSRTLIPGTYVYLITDARKRHYRWERRS